MFRDLDVHHEHIYIYIYIYIYTVQLDKCSPIESRLLSKDVYSMMVLYAYYLWVADCDVSVIHTK